MYPVIYHLLRNQNQSHADQVMMEIRNVFALSSVALYWLGNLYIYLKSIKMESTVLVQRKAIFTYHISHVAAAIVQLSPRKGDLSLLLTIQGSIIHLVFPSAIIIFNNTLYTRFLDSHPRLATLLRNRNVVDTEQSIIEMNTVNSTGTDVVPENVD